jgi:hypothetical protein
MGQCFSQGDAEAKRNHVEAENQLKKVNFPRLGSNVGGCADRLTPLGEARNGKGGKGIFSWHL